MRNPFYNTYNTSILTNNTYNTSILTNNTYNTSILTNNTYNTSILTNNTSHMHALYYMQGRGQVFFNLLVIIHYFHSRVVILVFYGLL